MQVLPISLGGTSPLKNSVFYVPRFSVRFAMKLNNFAVYSRLTGSGSTGWYNKNNNWEEKCLLWDQIKLFNLPWVPVFMRMACSTVCILLAGDAEAKYYCNLNVKSGSQFRPLQLFQNPLFSLESFNYYYSSACNHPG